MPKLYDSFLFFQELDLLELRLNYLNDKVDYFIIVEAGQTFSGDRKPFNYEINLKRFEKFNHKIIYHKIEDFHNSYSSLKQFLKSHDDVNYRNILSLLESENHYTKDHLPWVLDSYHRNCIQIPYQKYLAKEDFVILSDLDEIPSLEYLDSSFLNTLKAPAVMRQKEFMYFLNYYHEDNWFGSIVSKYEFFINKSLNIIRADSKSDRLLVGKNELNNGGYHFTHAGGLDLVISKIKSWGHQEFNTKGILNRLNYNISTGQDIFERSYGTILTSVEIENHDFFDENMTKLLINYPALLIKGKTRKVSKYSLYNWIKFLYYLKDKIFNKLVGFK